MESFATSEPNFSDQELLQSRDLMVSQMKWTREYSRQLIDSVPENRWYEIPPGLPTHLAWQVGHLAVSQYGLMLFRQRGRGPGDLELMPGWLRKQFGRGTTPAERTEKSPSPGDLLERLDKINEQAILEVSQLPADVLKEATEMPYTAYPIKLGALLFCPIHESIHAGQIGLLRRALGESPLR
ncbi:MAG: DinB family protein [Planctomycetota bacterium]